MYQTSDNITSSSIVCIEECRINRIMRTKYTYEKIIDIHKTESGYSSKYYESDRRWHTTYRSLSDDKKMPFASKTEDELRKFLISYYRKKLSNQNKAVMDTYKLEELFYGAIKARTALSKPSKDRYEADFIRFLKYSNLNRNITTISVKELKDFLIQYKTTETVLRTAYRNMMTVINLIYWYAREKELVAIYPQIINDDIKNAVFLPVKSKKARTYNIEQWKVIVNYCIHNLTEKRLAILGECFLGCRNGECVTLRTSEINNGWIEVNRTERTLKDENGKLQRIVHEHPKTKAGVREIPIPDILMECSKEVPFGKEWLFERDGERFKTYSVSKELQTVCHALRLPCYGVHALRRAYASLMNLYGIADATLTDLLGHEDIRTTQECYITNIQERKEVKDQINSIFKQVIGL